MVCCEQSIYTGTGKLVRDDGDKAVRITNDLKHTAGRKIQRFIIKYSRMIEQTHNRNALERLGKTMLTNTLHQITHSMRKIPKVLVYMATNTASLYLLSVPQTQICLFVA